MNRTQFTFYESFYEALQRIRSPEDRALAYDTLCAYALYGTEPDLDGLPDAVAITFHLIKPNLDASRRKADCGRLGGQSSSTRQANRKHSASKGESKKKKEEEKENEKETEIEREMENESSPPGPLRGRKARVESVPTLEQVEEAAMLAGHPEAARAFYDYYAAADWRDSSGRPVYSWRQKLQAWLLREEKQRPAQDQSIGGFSSWAELARQTERRHL